MATRSVDRMAGMMGMLMVLMKGDWKAVKMVEQLENLSADCSVHVKADKMAYMKAVH